MKWKDLDFGARMMAIRMAKVQLEKKFAAMKQEAAKIEDQFKPISPLDQPVTASLTLKPIEVTAPTPTLGQKLIIQPQTAMDLAIKSLRNEAWSKIEKAAKEL